MRARARRRVARASRCATRAASTSVIAPGARRARAGRNDPPETRPDRPFATQRAGTRARPRRAFTFFRFSVSAGNEIRVYRRFEAPSRRASAAPRRAIAGKRNETSAIDARARRSDRTRDAVGRAVGAVRVRVSTSKPRSTGSIGSSARRADATNARRATREARDARDEGKRRRATTEVARARRGSATTRDDAHRRDLRTARARTVSGRAPWAMGRPRETWTRRG